jgi:hypothetical protein
VDRFCSAGTLIPSASSGRSLVEALDKGIEAHLLLQDVRSGGLGRFLLQRQVHAFVPTVLL